MHIVHDFKMRTGNYRNKFFIYVTKGLASDNFLARFDDILNEDDFNMIDEGYKADYLQKCFERTCECMLRNMACAAKRKFCNY